MAELRTFFKCVYGAKEHPVVKGRRQHSRPELPDSVSLSQTAAASIILDLATNSSINKLNVMNIQGVPKVLALLR
jgi:hypothetical protein